MFFCVKRFRPIIRVENNSQEKFTVLHVPYIGFMCYLDSVKILLQGSWLENKGLIMHVAVRRFRKICFLNQSEE